MLLVTYRIDDIDFDQTPDSTFDRKGTPVSFKDYMMEQYEIQVTVTHKNLCKGAQLVHLHLLTSFEVKKDDNCACCAACGALGSDVTAGCSKCRKYA